MDDIQSIKRLRKRIEEFKEFGQVGFLKLNDNGLFNSGNQISNPRAKPSSHVKSDEHEIVCELLPKKII